MGGTTEGGRSAAMVSKQRYGKDHHQRIGAMGGAKGRTGGFAGDGEMASLIGKLGGRGAANLNLHDRQVILDQIEALKRKRIKEGKA